MRYYYKSALTLTSIFSSITGVVLALVKEKFKADYFKSVTILNDSVLLPVILRNQQEKYNTRRPALFFRIEPKLSNPEMGRNPYEFANQMINPLNQQFSNLDFLPKLFFSDLFNQSIAVDEQRSRFEFTVKLFVDTVDQGINIGNYLTNVFNIERPAFYNRKMILHELPNTIVYYLAKDRSFSMADHQSVLDFVSYLNSFSKTKFEVFTNTSTGKLAIGYYIAKNLLMSFNRPEVSVVKKDNVVDKAIITLNGWCEIAVPQMIYALSQNSVDSVDLLPPEPLLSSEGNNYASITVVKKVLPLDDENRIMIFKMTVMADANSTIELVDFSNHVNNRVKQFITSQNNIASGSNISVEVIRDGEIDLDRDIHFGFDLGTLSVSLFEPFENSSYQIGLYFSVEFNQMFLDFLKDELP